MRNLKLLVQMVALCLLFANAKAQNPDDPQMKMWMAYMTPGDPQKMMAKGAGDWKAEVTTMMDPTKPPVKSTATVHQEMILGGRYLTTHYTGMMMGQPFEGMGTIAYDNGKKMYLNTWVDNMGTGITYLEGMASADGKSIEFKGKSYDPMQGKDVMMREVVSFNGDNNQKIEFYSMMNGKDTKTMEINLTR